MIEFQIIKSPHSPGERGCLPQKNISEKYGCTNEYLGWFTKSGRIGAVRHGKYERWYASDSTPNKYQASLNSSDSKKFFFRESRLLSGSKPEYLLSESAVLFPAGFLPRDHVILQKIAPPVPERDCEVLLLSSEASPSVPEKTVVLCKNTGSYSAESGRSIFKFNVRVKPCKTKRIDPLGGKMPS